MSSDSRRTSRCFSWMSLNQSTSMSSSRLSGSQMRTEARAGSSSHSPQGEGLPPALGPARQALPGAHTVHPPTQLLLQLDPAVLQGIQLALNGVHLPVDVILGDVLVSLHLLDSTRSPKGHRPLLPPACCQELCHFSSRHWPLRAQGPALSHAPVGRDAGSQCGEGSVCRQPPPLHAPGSSTDRHTQREARLPPCLSRQPCPLLCHSQCESDPIRKINLRTL